jgi:hypothetical protein
MLKIKQNTNLNLNLNCYISNEISKHSAIEHPLFDFIIEKIQLNSLTARQFNFFRHLMFSRVFLTLPSITEALKSALLTSDEESIETCLRNLCEELAFNGVQIDISHPRLMEKTFNTVSKKLFKLEPTSLNFCYNNPILPEEVIYHSTVKQLYKKVPLIVSLSQEISSGGLPYLNKPGMMAQLYLVFFNLYLKNQLSISEDLFKKEILPYFSAHLSINSDFKLILDENAIEFQHGERAKNDYLKSKNSISEIKKDLPYFFAFLDAQKYLFDKTLSILEEI